MAEAKKRPLSALERARQQAAAQAEAFARREKDLTGLAVDYLLAGSALERALEQIERRMEPLRREQAQAQEEAQRARVGVVARMRALEAPESEVAARLGISLGEVRRSMALARSWDGEGEDRAVEGPEADPGADAEEGGGEAGAAGAGRRKRSGQVPGGGPDQAPPLPGAPPLPDTPPQADQVPGAEGWAWPSERAAAQ